VRVLVVSTFAPSLQKHGSEGDPYRHALPFVGEDGVRGGPTKPVVHSPGYPLGTHVSFRSALDASTKFF